MSRRRVRRSSRPSAPRGHPSRRHSSLHACLRGGAPLDPYLLTGPRCRRTILPHRARPRPAVPSTLPGWTISQSPSPGRAEIALRKMMTTRAAADIGAIAPILELARQVCNPHGISWWRCRPLSRMSTCRAGKCRRAYRRIASRGPSRLRTPLSPLLHRPLCRLTLRFHRALRLFGKLQRLSFRPVRPNRAV